MKIAVEKFWPYQNGSVEFKTREEIKALKKQKQNAHIVLMCHSFNSYTKHVPGAPGQYQYVSIPLPGLWWWKGIENNNAEWLNTMIVAERIEKWSESFIYKQPILKFILFDKFPGKSALAFGIKDFKMFVDQHALLAKVKIDEVYAFKAEEQKRNQSALTRKILLIRKDWLADGFSTEQIKLYYPFPYEVCDAKTLDQISIEGDLSKYMFAIVMPQLYFRSEQLIINPADNGEAFVTASEGKEPWKMTANTFEKLAERLKKNGY
jgi:hypothetical protein